jgi:flagellar motility protein MotE (MotC chaperone)
MNKIVRLFLMVVLTINAAGALALMLGGIPSAHAVTESGSEEAAAAPAYDRDALRLLGEQLALRSEQLEKREAELEELLRSEELLQRTAESAPGDTQKPENEPAEEASERSEDPAAPPLEPQVAGSANDEPTNDFAFEKLQRAYENMEPESAAMALSELAYLDQEAVVQLLISWPPRTSGAILDALTQADPMLAASLSYEIWKQGGKKRAAAASDSR